jgi:TolB-like protein/Tfp pilus assembly protein PilF
MTLRAEADEAESAMDAAQQLLGLDPLREDAHRLLMRLYDNAGRRSAALRQFQICEDVLRRELDVEPAPETLQLISEIRTRQEGAGPVAIDAGAATAQVRMSKRGPRLWAVVVVGLLLIGAGGAIWYFYPRGPESLTEIAKEAEMAFPLPEKPSIAVLPFMNLSGDPAQDQFIDGITEDITTALSIISEMFVIARTTALVYKGKPVNIVQVAEELGVRYVLEGSVQRADDRVRITAQLIDAVGGHHVWAEQYDREIRDIFAVQDEITLEIVTALRVQIAEGEQERVALIHGTRNLQAWLLGSQGTQRARQLTREDNALARGFFERAAALDPNYPGAWDGQAWTHLIDARFGWSESVEASIYRAAALAQKALELDPGRSRTYGLLGTIQLLSGNHVEAVALGENAVALDPNGAEVAVFLAVTLTYTGELERSVALTDRAMRLSPYYPDWYRWNLGRTYRLMGRYEDAVAALETRLAANPGALVPRIELAATYSAMGRQAEAGAMVAEVLKIHPGFSVRRWMRAPPYKDPAVMKREFGILRKAGLPE